MWKMLTRIASQGRQFVGIFITTSNVFEKCVGKRLLIIVFVLCLHWYECGTTMRGVRDGTSFLNTRLIRTLGQFIARGASRIVDVILLSLLCVVQLLRKHDKKGKYARLSLIIKDGFAQTPSLHTLPNSARSRTVPNSTRLYPCNFIQSYHRTSGCVEDIHR